MAAPSRNIPSSPFADLFREWPTWCALAFCYLLWILALALAARVEPVWLQALCLVAIGGYAGALHSSLQHEAIHGHPTRSAALNELLVWPALSVLFPYRRFRQTHLRHHQDARLTDPYDDPESWYLAEGDIARLSAPLKALLAANQTLAGRLLIGPWLSAFGLYRADLSRWRGMRGRAIRDAYLRHAPAALAPLAIAWAGFGIDPVTYLLCVAWPATALLMLRTFAEHRAAEQVGARSAVVEAEALLAFLFLNNNLHAVHHAHPRTPWYRLPEIWRRDRAALMLGNDGYVLQGYGEIARRWLFRTKEPLAHPFLRRSREVTVERYQPADLRPARCEDPSRDLLQPADVRLARDPAGDERALGGDPVVAAPPRVLGAG